MSASCKLHSTQAYTKPYIACIVQILPKIAFLSYLTIYAILGVVTLHTCMQVDTTKGTGGDVLILEEAAYVDPGFFYETVAPLTIVGNTSLLAISTLTSEINFYTRLIRMRDKQTGQPMFKVLSVQLACEKCKEEGKAVDCIHMLHLIPRWQSGERHTRLKTIMQDRPDLIVSELSGLAFDSLQQAFRTCDIETMMNQVCSFHIVLFNNTLHDMQPFFFSLSPGTSKTTKLRANLHCH